MFPGLKMLDTCVYGRGSVWDPAGVAYSTSPGPSLIEGRGRDEGNRREKEGEGRAKVYTITSF